MKHNKLVKFMMSGQMKATNTLARWGGGKGMAMYYRGGSDGTHSMSMGQTVREIEINKYYEQERKNNQKYLSQVANVLFGKDSPLEDQLLELYGVDENGKKIEGYQLPKRADGSIDFGQLDVSKLSELKGAKAQMEALASILDSEVNSLSSEDLLMAAAVAQGLAYDTGNEVLNLSGEQISEDTFSEKKKTAKEDKAGFFVVIAVDNINVSNDETQERIEGEVTEEVDEYTGQKRETTKIKITRKDAEEAIKQAVMEMGFASVGK